MRLLDALTVDWDPASYEDCYERAQEAGIPGRSSMTKKQLAGALDRKD